MDQSLYELGGDLGNARLTYVGPITIIGPTPYKQRVTGVMRNLLQAVLDELEKDVINLALLGEFEFLGGTQNLWVGPEGHSIQYDSKEWVAVGEIGAIDKLAEGQGLADSRTTVSLRIDSENISIGDVEDSRGRNATITLLLLSDEGVVIGPIDFRTSMGGVQIAAAVSADDQGRRVVDERLSLELLAETATLEQSHFVRNTYEAGRRIDSTDHGLEFVSDPEAVNVGLRTRAGGGGLDGGGDNPNTQRH